MLPPLPAGSKSMLALAWASLPCTRLSQGGHFWPPSPPSLPARAHWQRQEVVNGAQAPYCLPVNEAARPADPHSLPLRPFTAATLRPDGAAQSAGDGPGTTTGDSKDRRVPLQPSQLLHGGR